MQATRILAAATALSLLLIGCAPEESSAGPSHGTPGEEEAATADPATFVNRVWRVAESSQVQAGSLRVFLSDGTLVMADPHSTPALGTWGRHDEGMTITEEGRTYAVEILGLSEEELRIRIHGPGEPVDIRFEPADDWLVLAPEAAEAGPTTRITGSVHHLDLEGGVWVLRDDEGTNLSPTNLPAVFRVEGMRVEAVARERDDMVSIGMVGPIVELLRIRQSVENDAMTGEAEALWGTAWHLEDLEGAALLDDVQATLEFPETGKVAGNASCNRFFGSVDVSGSTLSFGPLGTTRRACADAVNDQERRYLAALQNAERFELEEPYLLLYSTELEKPLRLVQQTP